MELSYDPAKNKRNIRERGLSFDRAAELHLAHATIFRAHRNGENRFIALGCLDARLHLLCYLEAPTGMRAISFRRVNGQEAKKYGNLYDLADDDGDVRELTLDELAMGVRFSDLPIETQKKLTSRPVVIRPDGQPAYVPISSEILDRFEQTGGGWQKRIEDALREYLRTHAA